MGILARRKETTNGNGGVTAGGNSRSPLARLLPRLTPKQVPGTNVGWHTLSGPGLLPGRERMPWSIREFLGTYGGTDDSVIWVYACVNRISTEMAAYPWNIGEKDGEVLEREDVPEDLEDLLEMPNRAARLTYFDFAQLVTMDLELAGNSYWLKDDQNALRQPAALQRLRPEYVQIVADDFGLVTGYVYQVQGVSIPYDVEEIMHFKYPSPGDDLYGMGTVEAIQRELGLSLLQSQHVTGFYAEGARISGLLTIDGAMSDDQFQRMKTEFMANYVGGRNQFRIMIAEQGVNFTPIIEPPASSGVIELQPMTKDAIITGFGVPEFLLGGTAQAGIYKMSEAQHILTRNMMPRAIRYSERMTNDLIALWGDLLFEVDQEVAETQEDRTNRASIIWGAGGPVSFNEWREMVGLPPLDDENADVPTILEGRVPYTRAFEEPEEPPLEGEYPPELPPPGGDETAQAELPSGEPDVNALPDGLEYIEEGLLSASKAAAAEVVRPFGPGSRKRAAKVPKLPAGLEPLPDELHLTEADPAVAEEILAARVDDWPDAVKAMENALREHFVEQRKRILAKMKNFDDEGKARRVNGRRGREVRYGKKALGISRLWDDDEENASLRDAFLRVVDEIAAKLFAKIAPTLGISLNWKIENPRIGKVRDLLAKRVTRVNETTKAAIAETVQEGLRRGYSIPQIANGFEKEKFPGVVGVFDRASLARAETIARTEAANVQNAASIVSYGEADVDRVEVVDGVEWDDACVVGETPVLPVGQVRAAYARWSEGEVVHVATDLGDELAVTPNHPVLTPGGWVAAGLLREGDEVVRARLGRGRAGGGGRGGDAPDDDYEPAIAEELAELLLVAARGRVVRKPTRAADFHGDGAESDVHVVAANRLLDDHVGVPLAEESDEDALVAGAGPAVRLATAGGPSKLVLAASASAGGLVRRPGEGAAAFRADPGETNGHGLGAAADRDERSNGTNMDAVETGDLGETLAGAVEGDDRLALLLEALQPEQDSVLGEQGLDPRFRASGQASDRGERLSSQVALLDQGGVKSGDASPWDAVLVQETTDSLPSDPKLGRDPVHVAEVLVETAKIIGIDRTWRQGHVYNFETGSGIYIAGGIVSSNCREANGQIWTLGRAMREPTEHPNCTRAFIPIIPEPESEKRFDPNQPRDEDGRWTDELGPHAPRGGPRLSLKGEKKLAPAAAEKEIQKMADSFADFYGVEKPEIRYEPDATATWGTEARALIPPSGKKQEVWYGDRIMETIQEPDYGVHGFRQLAHEQVHASLSGTPEGPLPGFSQTFEEGSAEILSLWFWRERGQILDERDAVRRDGKWTSDPADSLAASVVYRPWTAETLRRAASRVGWDRDEIVAEVRSVMGGDHSARLAWRDATDPDFPLPDGVKANRWSELEREEDLSEEEKDQWATAEALIRWLVSPDDGEEKKAFLVWLADDPDAEAWVGFEEKAWEAYKDWRTQRRDPGGEYGGQWVSMGGGLDLPSLSASSDLGGWSEVYDAVVSEDPIDAKKVVQAKLYERLKGNEEVAKTLAEMYPAPDRDTYAPDFYEEHSTLLYAEEGRRANVVDALDQIVEEATWEGDRLTPEASARTPEEWDRAVEEWRVRLARAKEDGNETRTRIAEANIEAYEGFARDLRKMIADASPEDRERYEAAVLDLRDVEKKVDVARDESEFVARIGEFVHQWATSSGNTHGRSLVIQEAVAREFGLPLNNLDGKLAVAQEEIGQYEEGPLDFAGMIDGVRPVVRAMYDETQEWFRQRGVTSVRAYRGMAFPAGTTIRRADLVAARDAQARQLAIREAELETRLREGDANPINRQMIPAVERDIDRTRETIAEIDQELAELDEAGDDPNPFRPGFSRQPVITQPISSYSLDVHVAEDFSTGIAGEGTRHNAAIVAASVPVSRILATPQTGFGATAESEMVVLGQREPDEVWVAAWHGPGENFTGDDVYVALEEGKEFASRAALREGTEGAVVPYGPKAVKAPEPVNLDRWLINADWVKRVARARGTEEKAWREAEHPRDRRGRFAEKPGGGILRAAERLGGALRGGEQPLGAPGGGRERREPKKRLTKRQKELRETLIDQVAFDRAEFELSLGPDQRPVPFDREQVFTDFRIKLQARRPLGESREEARYAAVQEANDLLDDDAIERTQRRVAYMRRLIEEFGGDDEEEPLGAPGGEPFAGMTVTEARRYARHLRSLSDDELENERYTLRNERQFLDISDEVAEHRLSYIDGELGRRAALGAPGGEERLILPVPPSEVRPGDLFRPYAGERATVTEVEPLPSSRTGRAPVRIYFRWDDGEEDHVVAAPEQLIHVERERGGPSPSDEPLAKARRAMLQIINDAGGSGVGNPVIRNALRRQGDPGGLTTEKGRMGAELRRLVEEGLVVREGGERAVGSRWGLTEKGRAALTGEPEPGAVSDVEFGALRAMFTLEVDGESDPIRIANEMRETGIATIDIIEAGDIDRVLGGLEERGLVRSRDYEHPTFGRRKLYQLTPQGHTAIGQESDVIEPGTVYHETLAAAHAVAERGDGAANPQLIQAELKARGMDFNRTLSVGGIYAILGNLEERGLLRNEETRGASYPARYALTDDAHRAIGVEPPARGAERARLVAEWEEDLGQRGAPARRVHAALLTIPDRPQTERLVTNAAESRWVRVSEVAKATGVNPDDAEFILRNSDWVEEDPANVTHVHGVPYSHAYRLNERGLRAARAASAGQEPLDVPGVNYDKSDLAAVLRTIPKDLYLEHRGPGDYDMPGLGEPAFDRPKDETLPPITDSPAGLLNLPPSLEANEVIDEISISWFTAERQNRLAEERGQRGDWTEDRIQVSIKFRPADPERQETRKTETYETTPENFNATEIRNWAASKVSDQREREAQMRELPLTDANDPDKVPRDLPYEEYVGRLGEISRELNVPLGNVGTPGYPREARPEHERRADRAIQLLGEAIDKEAKKTPIREELTSGERYALQTELADVEAEKSRVYDEMNAIAPEILAAALKKYKPPEPGVSAYAAPRFGTADYHIYRAAERSGIDPSHVTIDDLGWEGKDFFRKKARRSKRHKALNERFEELKGRRYRITGTLDNPGRMAHVARRDAYLRALAMARPMGGEIKLTTTRGEGHDDIQAVSGYFPSDWIRRSGEHRYGLLAARSKSRGHYQNLGYRRAHGTISEIKISGSPSGIPGENTYLPTATHEMMHRMEYSHIAIKRAERRFYDHRTAGEAAVKLSKLRPGYRYRSDEIARPDRFSEPYMGKDYGRDAFELMTMGLEGIMHGKYQMETDDEYRRWVLGVLAGV